MTRSEVYHALDTERAYQARRWGVRTEPGQFLEQPHSIAEWVLYTEHYLAAARALASTRDPETPALEPLRKVAALLIACFEQHGVPGRDPDAPVVNGRDGLPA